ncbi:regulatory protein RecX [Microbacterium sp. ASV49]|uniref:Regulatory protein RecX n=1 Tax=Microbacterium candidum TaxID=3041922 RepID=A0ABT7N1E1_9MICO|nr:regulatory protein RecX [Microbacterium sp. ASV49]MDL9980528.1 regulatory protein RecX [Microbacterium sp. ASV49]
MPDEHDGLAPVIPLFGDRSPSGDGSPARERRVSARDVAGDEISADDGPPAPAEATWRTEWDDDPEEQPAAHRKGGSADLADDDVDPEAERDLAEQTLLKKLRTRSLSVREARAVVAERDLDDETVDAVIRVFERHGYLDDAALAGQLVHSGVDRKGQGRQVIAQTLAKRGIPRDIADAALDELPDDDLERALEFARTKARSMTSLDRDTALRRLVGQLSRRGYGGSLAMTAARQALDEGGGSRSSVRFR